MKKLNERLREIRKNRNFLQSDIARILKISTTTYNGYETGKHSITPETLIDLAKVYGVSSDYLLCLTDIQNPSVSPKDQLELDIAYAKLNIEGKKKAREFVIDLLSNTKYALNPLSTITEAVKKNIG